MRIDSTPLRPDFAETETDVRVTERTRSARLDPVDLDSVQDGAAPAVAFPTSAAVPWMDPDLGGRTALGSPDQYLPLLQSLYDELSQRQDSVARFGSAAIMEELRNHAVLSGQINSLIA